MKLNMAAHGQEIFLFYPAQLSYSTEMHCHANAIFPSLQLKKVISSIEYKIQQISSESN
jgi:hypothetical protein